MQPGQLLVCLAAAEEAVAGAAVAEEVLEEVVSADSVEVVLAAAAQAVVGKNKIDINKNASVLEAFLFGGISFYFIPLLI